MTNIRQSGKLIVVGFSTRALAEAARSTGRQLHAVDHFGDADLREQVDSWRTIPWRGDQVGPGAQAQANQIVGAIARDLRVMSESRWRRLPVLLAGGMENWPELLRAFTASFEVLGPSCEQLKYLRDPRWLSTVARRTGLKFPDTVFTFSQLQPAADEPWLAKSPDGSGGLAVRRVPTSGTQPFPGTHPFPGTQPFPGTHPQPSATGTQPSAAGTQQDSAVGPLGTHPTGTPGTQHFSEAAHAMGTLPDWDSAGTQPSAAGLDGGRPVGGGADGLGAAGAAIAAAQPEGIPRTTYWQRWLAGRSLGITCILHTDAPVQLLGATESWDALDWPGPAEFVYRGSWGPVELSPAQQRVIREFAEAVQRKTGLRGWLQMDCIEQPDGELALLEVNPRWTAGMEILHLAGMRPVARHLEAWGVGGPPNMSDAYPAGARQLHGKAVVYARQAVEVTTELRGALGQLPPDEVADIPAELGSIPAGHPVLTVRTRLERAEAASSTRLAIRTTLLSQLRKQGDRIAHLLER